ncbi:MAG TPA: proline dehydrogenase family protein [Acidobacteriota bacterium]
MNPLRSALLAGSQSAWLRERATRYQFVKRAVSRFMPGETLDEALRAAETLRGQGLATILTCLGENVENAAEADAVVRHYVEAFDRIAAAGLDAWISIKLTQLGLDQDRELAYRNLEQLAQCAAAHKNQLWIDMEGSAYTDVTLELFGRLRRRHANIGVALQAYLKRTAADLERLLPLGPSIRLVKGAYREPAAIAFPSKRDVDRNFFALAQRLLSPAARQAGAWVAFGTHDEALIQKLRAEVAALNVPREAFEFELLYGIQTAQQTGLARAGFPTRVLISYGEYWFPWYMRRLAERPANLLFVLRHLF